MTFLVKNSLADYIKKIWVLLVEAFGSFQRNNDLIAASSLAFSAMLALIPALFFFTFVLSGVMGSSQEAIARTQQFLAEVLPSYGDEILREVRALSAHRKTMGILNLVVLLWMISPLVSGMRSALGVVFRKRPKRHFVLQKLLDVSITAVFLLGLSAVAVAGVLMTVLEKSGHLGILPGYARSLAPFSVVTGVVFGLYFIFSPRMKFKHIIAGALTTSVLWSVMRPAFTLFLTYNPGYGVAFGSFKSLFVVIIWIYYSLAVFLFGSEVAANLHRKDAVFVRRLMEGRGGVPEAVLRRFVISFDPGDVIFLEGDNGSEMYSVRKGNVSIRKGDKEIALIGEGSFFGEMSFLLGMPRSATAVAAEETELIVISNHTVGTLMNEFPEFVLRMLREMAARLRETNRYVS